MKHLTDTFKDIFWVLLEVVPNYSHLVLSDHTEFEFSFHGKRLYISFSHQTRNCSMFITSNLKVIMAANITVTMFEHAIDILVGDLYQRQYGNSRFLLYDVLLNHYDKSIDMQISSDMIKRTAKMNKVLGRNSSANQL